MEQEIWKPIDGFEDFYDVSNLGNVYSYNRKRKKTPDTGRDGRLYVNLWKNNRSHRKSIQRLVAETFHPDTRADGLEVAHNNGVRTDNRASNLRWCTPKENAADKVLHGTLARGERIGNSRLKEDDILEIRISLKSAAELAKAYGVNVAHIRRIRSYERWGWLV